MKRANSIAPAVPRFLHNFHRYFAIRWRAIGVPSNPPISSNSRMKSPAMCRHVAASISSKASMREAVTSRSLVTPSHRPSGKAVAKVSAVGASSKPCLANAAPCSAWKADPANSDRFIAPRSCLKPGEVTSAVFTAPPGISALSNTPTRQPCTPRCAADASPLIPDPMITASKLISANSPRFLQMQALVASLNPYICAFSSRLMRI